MTATRRSRAALLIVDVQRDFCPGGALPAPGGDRILPGLNRYIADARAHDMPVYASRDWHPAITNHFKEYGGEWPPHCVQGSEGAAFHPRLELPDDAIVITKGDDPERPGYSAFDGRTEAGAPFLDELRQRHIDKLYVTGIATDYCVKASVLDARRAGIEVTVLTDAIAPIDARPGDADRAIAEMIAAGARTAREIADVAPQ
jgi:nicotinamidase/pyrazinamidase